MRSREPTNFTTRKSTGKQSMTISTNAYPNCTN